MPEVLNKDLQVLCSRLFRILINYSLQLNCILLGKDVTPIFQPFKVVICSFAQLIKRNTKGVALKVNIVVVKGQAAQHHRIGLAEFLFGNISLLIKVRKDSQFEVKVVVFTAVLGFVGIELSQVGQLLTISLYLSWLRICNLGRLRICSLGSKKVLVRNLRIRCTLARKINSKITQIYRINLVKQVRYKASNYIKFKKNKEFLSSVKLVQDFFLNLFYLVLLIYYIIQRLYHSNSFVPFNLYALVI